MKKVEGLIRPSSLKAVVEALDRLDVGGVTVSEVAPSSDAPFRGSYRGASYVVDTSPGLRVEVVSTDAHAGPIAWAIATAARTGHPGDGIVSIETVEDARRIRTGERGVAAVSARPDADDMAHPSVAPSARHPTPDRAGASNRTKVVLTNVAATTAFLVAFLHAPAGWAAMGAGSAGLALWVRDRWARRPR